VRKTQITSQAGPRVERRDPVVAAESGKLGSGEATVGLHPLMGAIQRVGQHAARHSRRKW